MPSGGMITGGSPSAGAMGDEPLNRGGSPDDSPQGGAQIADPPLGGIPAPGGAMVGGQPTMAGSN